jgi:hypothetical protein
LPSASAVQLLFSGQSSSSLQGMRLAVQAEQAAIDRRKNTTKEQPRMRMARC